jgi:hypothetical protein
LPAVCEHDASPPTWSSSTRRRLHRLGVEAGPNDEPGDERVPHLSPHAGACSITNRPSGPYTWRAEVVEDGRIATLEAGGDRLEDEPVEADKMSARPER